MKWFTDLFKKKDKWVYGYVIQPSSGEKVLARQDYKASKYNSRCIQFILWKKGRRGRPDNQWAYIGNYDMIESFIPDIAARAEYELIKGTEK